MIIMDIHGTPSPLCILLIDDSEHDRQAFRRAFQKSDVPVEITECVRAEEAMDQLRKDDSLFDLVVTDYKLPGMSGLRLCQELLNQEVSLPLVLLTGAGSEPLAVEALKSGVHDYIIKDPNGGYLDLLPVVLPEVVRQYHDRLARKQAEEEIRRMNKELEQKLILSEKMAALGSLVAEATHEISTPVSTGITAVSSLNEKTREMEELFHDEEMTRSALEAYLTTGKEVSQIVLSNLKRAAELIRSFKVVAVDRCSEERRQFNVREYLDEILLSLRPKLKKTRHTVTVNCPGDLELDNDPGAFSQIISNLVVNSLIHGFENTDQGKIVIDISQENDTVVLKYSDNGKGIEKDHLAKIFDPFFTTKRGKGGSGIGMNIVYKLVTQKLNGHIECASTPGVGTTFTIQIPITSPYHPQGITPPCPPQGGIFPKEEKYEHK